MLEKVTPALGIMVTCACAAIPKEVKATKESKIFFISSV
jgi:hypothetical protein